MICQGIVKLLMVIFNSVIFIAGAVTLGIGFLVSSDGKYGLGILKKTIEILPLELKTLASIGYLLIAVGAVLAFMGFLGCCGAYCEDNCMLGTFFIIILIVFIAEVAAAVLVLLYRPEAEELLDNIRGKVAKNIKENYGRNNIITKGWNETMNLVKCCGYNNYTDFNDSPFVSNTSQYPQFCCPESPELCDIKEASAESERVHGCFEAVVNLVKKNSSLLGGVAICVAALEVAVMIMTLLLYKK